MSKHSNHRTALLAVVRATAVLSLLATGAMGREAAAQDSTRVAILPIRYPTDSILHGLEIQLRDAINRMPNLDLAANIVPDSLLGTAQPPFSDSVLTSIAQRSVYDFYVITQLWPGAPFTGTVSVRSKTLKSVADFRVEGISEHSIIRSIADNLVVHLAKNIRIAVLRFPMTGGDTSLHVLERALPNMLATGLDISRRLALIESLDESVLDSQQVRAAEASGIYNRQTAVRIGRRHYANYLVMGEFWELGGDLRIDVRCVSIESGEVVVTRGINIYDLKIETIHERMMTLAAELRSAIESDYADRVRRPRYVAVSGFPPSPNTGENRETLEGIVKTFSRKLQQLELPGVRVRQNSDTVRTFLKQRYDRWFMSAALNVNLLITFELDRTQADQFILTVDVFNTEDPTDFHSWTETAAIDNVDQALDSIVLKFLASQGLTIEPQREREMSAIKYRGLFRTLGLRFRVGAIYRNEPDLFLGAGGGGYFRVGLVWMPFRSPNWQLEPLHIRLSLIGQRPDRVVIGADVWFLSVNYRLRPYHSFSPYVGGSIGFLGVYRDAPTDFQYDALLGLGATAGFEHRIGSSFKLNYELEYAYGLGEIPPATIGGEVFSGGRPGGLYLTLATGFGF